MVFACLFEAVHDVAACSVRLAPMHIYVEFKDHGSKPSNADLIRPLIGAYRRSRPIDCCVPLLRFSGLRE
eukprot:9492135-Pyramimonas_sp.AAC.1